MSQNQPVPGLNWTIVEAGDRWYQAVLRFTAGPVPHDRDSVRHLPLDAASELVVLLAQRGDRRHMVLWEIPAAPSAWLEIIDAIASVRRSNPQAVQLASLPCSASHAAALAVQQAGVTVLLGELWTLEPLARRLASRVA